MNANENGSLKNMQELNVLGQPGPKKPKQTNKIKNPKEFLLFTKETHACIKCRQNRKPQILSLARHGGSPL
jgi:hypothetical protein